MSALPEDLTHWDEFTELVFTIRDEVVPTRVPVASDFTAYLAHEVVLFILRDPDMRALMVELLRHTEEEQ